MHLNDIICPGYVAKLDLIVKPQLLRLKKHRVPLIDIILISILTRNDSKI